MCNISDVFSLFTPRCASLSSSRSEGDEAERATLRAAPFLPLLFAGCQLTRWLRAVTLCFAL